MSVEKSALLAPPIPVIKNKTVGQWNHLHKKSENLLGVRVQQFPDDPHESPNYEGKHPAMVIYVFKSMKARQVEYSPDGTITSDFWWDVSKNDKILERLKKY